MKKLKFKTSIKPKIIDKEKPPPSPQPGLTVGDVYTVSFSSAALPQSSNNLANVPIQINTTTFANGVTREPAAKVCAIGSV